MTDQISIKLATLGRPIHLGMLYDIRSDILLPNATLWSQRTLTNNIVEVPQFESWFEVLVGDSVKEKAHTLGVEGSAKLNLVGGFIDIVGSAKYVQDSITSGNIARVTLKYYTTTKWQQLKTQYLGKGSSNNPKFFDVNKATNVVTGVLYGAEAFFVFDHRVSQYETKKTVEKSLCALINKIPYCPADSTLQMNFNETEKELMKTLNCTVYSDFQLKKNPNSFEEAVALFSKLPSLLGENKEKVVVKRARLHPLRLFDDRAMAIVIDISLNLVDHSMSLIEDLHGLRIRALDLLENIALDYLHHMMKHLKEFVARLSEFERNLKKDIADLLLQIRGGVKKEKTMSELFERINASPFNTRRLTYWIENKENEVRFINQWFEALRKQPHIIVNTSSLANVIGNIDYHYIVCLSFRIVDQNETQLVNMNKYLQRNLFQNSCEEVTPWFKEPGIINRIHTNINQFIEFSSVNNISTNPIKFVANEEYPMNDIKDVVVELYENGERRRDFRIPSKPGTPKAKRVTTSSITLEWTDTEGGSEKINWYTIMYQRYDEQIWNEISTEKNVRTMCLPNFQPKTMYRFKVKSRSMIGFSTTSEISQPISTKDDMLLGFVYPRFPHNSNSNTGNEFLKNARWSQNGVTIIGGKDPANGLNRLTCPYVIRFADDGTVYIADFSNHRIVSWRNKTSVGVVVAGGNGQGYALNQLNYPTDVFFDKGSNSLIICDRDNNRVMLWKLQTTIGEIVVDNVNCWGIAIDNEGLIYVSEEDRIMKYRIGDTNGILVAGGNGYGDHVNQLNEPHYLFIDRNQSVYVSDFYNHRVMKWEKHAKQGIIVAGGNGYGSDLNQLNSPNGILVDELDTVYVADYWNHRVTRWHKGSRNGDVIVGGNGRGDKANQFNGPIGLSLDREANLYVADEANRRIQKFSIK